MYIGNLCLYVYTYAWSLSYLSLFYFFFLFSCYIKNFYKISNIISKIDKTINSINFI